MTKHLMHFKVIVFTSLLLFFGISVIAQTQIQPIQYREDCGADLLHKKMMQSNPTYVQRMQDFKNHVSAQASSITPKSTAIYQIPVVVHVIHKGEAVGTGSNVSDEDIYKTIREMNERFCKTLPGLQGVDMEIEFVLAVRSPSNQCTNGITRVDMTSYPISSIANSYMNHGVAFSTTDGITDDELKAITFWDQTKYYNIYLVSEFDGLNGSSGLNGYAYLAAAHGALFDGAAIYHQAFTDEFSKTTSHELGHALNLFHTFEDDDYGNACPPSDPTLGDECADTPPHIRSITHCNLIGTNACDGNSSNALYAQNYMDYSSSECSNQFTQNQKDRALAACSYFRASFFDPANLALVPISAPVADFSISGSIICSGQPISFFNNSSCVPNTFLEGNTFPNSSFAWTFTNGTVTLNSTDQNPIINFTSPGSYDVTLTVTTLHGSSTITKNFIVSITGSMMSACIPTSTNNGYFAYTISNVKFNTINSYTSNIKNSYQDLTCSKNTIVHLGSTYPLSLTANNAGQLNEYVEVYIDYNNDGQFTPTELIYSNMAAMGTAGYINSTDFTTNITIPASAVINTMLRMRVIGESAIITNAKRNCTANYSIGDIQDYGVMITPSCIVAPTISAQPVAANSCTGSTVFFAVTSPSVTTYQWQVSDDGGIVWSDLSNGGQYANTTTQTLTISGITTALNMYQYRCVLTNTCGTTISSGENLTVNLTPSIVSTTPNNRCGPGVLTLDATSSAGTISWYSSPTGGSAVGTGPFFLTPAINSTQTYYVSTSEAGCSSPRTAVVATINKDVIITSNPSNTTICEGQSINLYAFNGSGFTWSNGQTGNMISVSPTQTTTYTVNGTSLCATTASITVTVQSCLGVNESDQEDLLVLYPNPTNSHLTIEGVSLINYNSVELRDVTGRLILMENVNGAKMNIDLTQIANGNYIIQVIGTEKTVTRKVQVVR